MIKLMISDLTYINEIAKVLKQKNFMWYHDLIIGVDNLDYSIYGALNTDRLSVYPENGIIMNQRDLSKVMKSITTESYFEFEDTLNKNTQLISTISDSMTMSVDVSIMNIIINNLKKDREIDMDMMGYLEENITSNISDLYNVSKYTGTFWYKYDNDHMMALIPGVLPLAKSDKTYLTIQDYPDNTFVSRFRIEKKLTDVHIYLKFLKI